MVCDESKIARHTIIPIIRSRQFFSASIREFPYYTLGHVAHYF